MEKKSLSKLISTPWVWCATTYYSEGLPYAVIRSLTPFFLRTAGASLQSIGLTALFGIPWTIKFFWGPQVDAYSTKRRWLVFFDITIAVVFASAAFLTLGARGPVWVGMIFFVGSFAAATHDIAIDGFYLSALDKVGQAKFIGYRTMAFRLAWITANRVIIDIGNRKGWFWAFLVSGLIMAFLFLFHLFFLPEHETPSRPFPSLARRVQGSQRHLLLFLLLPLLVIALVLSRRRMRLEPILRYLKGDGFPLTIALLLLSMLLLAFIYRKSIFRHLTARPDSFYARAFLSFMDQPKIAPLLAFIILVRTGEWLQSNMVPTFMVDLGLKMQYPWISGYIGLPMTVIGAMLGGWVISRRGIKKTIWPFLALQNGANLVYMALAFGLSHTLQLNTGNPTPVLLSRATLALVALVHGLDQFSSGLGNAILSMVIMRTCKPEFKAAHFAIGSGLMSLTGIIAGLFSGVLASKLGYGLFFGVTFLAALPGMLMIFFLPKE